MPTLVRERRATAPGRWSIRPRRLAVLLGFCGLMFLFGAWLWGRDICVHRGAVLLDARRHEPALQWLRWAEWMDGDDAEVHYQLARAHRRLRHFDEVEHHLQRAHDLGWNVAKLEREQLIALAQDGQYERLAGQWGWLLQNAGSDAPEIAEAFVTERASKFMVHDAQLVLGAWSADYPADPQPRFWRGKIFEVLNAWTEAAKEYQAALELAPQRLDIRLRLAQAMMRQLKFEEALVHLRSCVGAKDHSSEAAIALAQCLNKLGQVEEAEAILRGELQQDPKNVAALRELADLELAGGNFQSAMELARRAMEIEPIDRELHYVLARALQRLGHTAEAQRELALVNEATRPVLRLAKISPQLAKDPGNVPIRFEIASTIFKYKSRSEGVRWLHSVLEFDPQHATTHELLAKHYEETGDRDRARWHRERIPKATVPAPPDAR